MDYLKITHAKKLKRKNADYYLATITPNELRELMVKEAPQRYSNEFIHIYTNNYDVNINQENTYDLTLKNFYVITELPCTECDDEFPLLVTNESPSSLIINSLLEIEIFNSFIELKNKISNNSTKVMTFNTLQKIVGFLFDKYSLDEIVVLMSRLNQYVENTINQYEFFKKYSVKELQNLKQRSIINSSTSWYIILKFFLEKNKNDVYYYQEIPKLNLDVSINDWNGNFFDKNNPVWDEVYNSKKKFYPTRESLEKVYEIWKSYL